MSRDLVLVVDDNPTNLKLMRALLAASGYDVLTAPDGESALALLATQRPSVALLDIQLPGMDGLALARHVRAQPAMQDLVLVAVTADAMVGTREDAFAAGFDGFVTKPVDTRSFPLTLADYVARGRRGGAE
jgi:CheY-like chemotaxis protein